MKLQFCFISTSWDKLYKNKKWSKLFFESFNCGKINYITRGCHDRTVYWTSLLMIQVEIVYFHISFLPERP